MENCAAVPGVDCVLVCGERRHADMGCGDGTVRFVYAGPPPGLMFIFK